MVTVQNADTYFQNEVLHNELWLGSDYDRKQRALRNAENMLYRAYPVFDPMTKQVPEVAVYEQAYHIMLIDETIQKASLGVKQVSISGISISVEAPTYPISPEVRMVLKKYGVGGVRLGRSRL